MGQGAKEESFYCPCCRVLEGGPAVGCTEGKVCEEGSGAVLAQNALQCLPTWPREERDDGHEVNGRLDRDRGQEKAVGGKEKERPQLRDRKPRTEKDRDRDHERDSRLTETYTDMKTKVETLRNLEPRQ